MGIYSCRYKPLKGALLSGWKGSANTSIELVDWEPESYILQDPYPSYKHYFILNHAMKEQVHTSVHEWVILKLFKRRWHCDSVCLSEVVKVDYELLLHV